MHGRRDDRVLYDRIGVGYGTFRHPDPRIERRLHAALGGASRVLNVGAGAGSYEPVDRRVVAVEPSAAMLAQRPSASAPTVRGVAEHLPFGDGAFDGALALLTVHHWPDPMAGLEELRRVTAGPVVVLTFDRHIHGEQWLVAEYLPAMLDLDASLPSPTAIAEGLGGGAVEVLPIPHDCVDGFCHAWWRRPEAYLDPAVRAAISGIARLPADVVRSAMSRLSDDLAGGAWYRTHEDLLGRDEIDAGYRIVISPGR
jgi:SAM-dependent methyltransferase